MGIVTIVVTILFAVIILMGSNAFVILSGLIAVGLSFYGLIKEAEEADKSEWVMEDEVDES
jgi:predicted membrane protein